MSQTLSPARLNTGTPVGVNGVSKTVWQPHHSE
ncbi:Uncharacterised protein [Pantoea agglomerans]|uniref:Uncharacterized protein n=1 Tax=Enterobacter agglomerans TaxID=549 RepID=A0A379AJU2_ENTAG|nr:Uncharacterised protein [Pantoea agglomerans]